MASSKTTRDHEEIRRWAEKRDAVPCEVSGTERDGDTGVLSFEFPKASSRNDKNLSEISWDAFFQKFDENNLELLYQEKTAEGAQSNFNKLLHLVTEMQTSDSSDSSPSPAHSSSSTHSYGSHDTSKQSSVVNVSHNSGHAMESSAKSDSKRRAA
jgi:hypothetical protein